jgi:hypothetical protein
MNDIKFKSTSKAPICLLSNLYGGVEINYMILKFQNSKVKELLSNWLSITSVSEMNKIRYQLERCKVDQDGNIIPKGGKSGLPYTDRQKNTYCCEYKGKLYVAVGILAKLAAATWHEKNHKDRIKVLKVLAKLNFSDSLGNTIPNHEYILPSLRKKYTLEPFKTILLNTNSSRLAELDGRTPNQWTDTGGNRLGNMLMQIRKEL